VEADHGDAVAIDAMRAEKIVDRLRVRRRNQRLRLGQHARPGGAVGETGRGSKDAAQQVALALPIRPVTDRTEARDGLAVALDQCRIDAVERGAAHQPERREARHSLSTSVESDAGPVTPPAHSTTGVTPMSTYKSEFLQVLADRGFIHQVSDAAGLDARAAAGPITAYVGLDATAPSLHIGNLITIMMLRWLQKTGHRPIALMGGGTSKIGDPSGKDASRTLLSNEQIDRNIASIRTVFDRFLDFPPALMANNADWLDRL